MLETLRMVRGSVDDRNLVAVYSHFHITPDGWIYGSNNRLTVRAPFPKISDHTITILAEKFIAMVEKCEGDPDLKIDDTHIFVRSKVRKSRVYKLPLSDEHYPIPSFDGDPYDMPSGYLDALARIRPFISNDATRPWAMGAIHLGGALYATNNIVLVRTPSPWLAENPDINVPDFAVDEIRRLRMNPKRLRVAPNALVFELDNDVMLRTVLYDSEWPDNLPQMVPDVSELPVLPKETAQIAKDVLVAETDSRLPVIIFEDNVIKTRDAEISGQDELKPEEQVGRAAFHAKPLLLVLDRATHFDARSFPKPCAWKSDELEGVIIGVRF